jgi:hypothetical protein
VALVIAGLAVQGPPAGATDGEPILAARDNTQTLWTELYDPALFPFGCAHLSLHDGLVVCGENALIGRGTNNGVTGTSHSSLASGVYGENNAFSGGYGAAGRASHPGGVAVLADQPDPSGVALRTTGRLEFQNRSGTATVAVGQANTVVNIAGVTSSSMVLATIQQNKSGYWIRAAVPGSGKITIHLNKATTETSGSVKIAYLVMN